MNDAVISVEPIETLIHIIRDQKVIVDADLARLYGVTTKALNQAIRRNRDRFPEDFVFQLTPEEKNEVVTNCDHLRMVKYSRQLPHVFTEHGAIMAANVLNSERAIAMSVYVVRAFINLKGSLKNQGLLLDKLDELERRLTTHDSAIRSLFSAIKNLMQIEKPKRRPIGFKLRNGKD